MRHHRFHSLILLGAALSLSGAAPVCAQSRQQKGSGGGEGFRQFREQMLSDFKGFRDRILDQYADFLDGVWHPYEPLVEGSRYDSAPKPDKAPAVDRAPVSRRKPTLDTPAPPTAPAPVAGTKKPGAGRPAPPPRPAAPSAGNEELPEMKFDFYGMELSLPLPQVRLRQRMASDSDRAAQFRDLRAGHGPAMAAAVGGRAEELGLNGYLTLRLAEKYLQAAFPDVDQASLYSALHYILTELGYDVRLARADSGLAILLVPFEQKVGESYFLQLDGKTYTAIVPEDVNPMNPGIARMYTCDLPQGVDKGRTMDLRLQSLQLPYKAHKFDIKGGSLELTGETNANLYPLLLHYPLMPMADFASSDIDPELRAGLVRQVKEQLAGVPADEAVNRLMEFFHKGFDYATDTQQFGREKPYFIEETLYYPANDCEDRAIMFSWLVWNALGLPAHLTAYPGHESAAVAVECEEPGPYSYKYHGVTYRNTDPTFIGSRIGEVMGKFATTPPEIEKTYPAE